MKRLGKTTRPGTWKVVQTLIIRAWTTCFKYWKIVFFMLLTISFFWFCFRIGFLIMLATTTTAMLYLLIIEVLV